MAEQEESEPDNFHGKAWNVKSTSIRFACYEPDPGFLHSAQALREREETGTVAQGGCRHPVRG